MADSTIPDRFEILEELARTPAEILLRARDKTLMREVVLKLPNPGMMSLEDTRFFERALREAQTLAQLRHPGVVRLHEVLESKSGPILVMEPVAGEPLCERLSRRTRLTPEEVRRLGIELCSALEAIHAVGVVHRGISTDNVVLRADGSACLTGFGFAKFGPGGRGVPGTTFVYRPAAPGSSGHAPRVLPAHPAPEQVRGQTADARSDVFGLGWVLYQCLTGEAPYPHEQDPEEWTAPRDARRLAPDARKSLVEALLRCLSVSPLRRFASAKEVREALEAAVARPARAGSRRPTRALLLVGGAVASLFALFWIGQRLLSDEALARGESVRNPWGIDPPREVQVGEYSEGYGQSHALLIGIGEVPGIPGLSRLPNAERDVEALGRCLNELQRENWNIRPLTGRNATVAGIRDELGKLSLDAKKNDKVFVYYAGHGVKNPKSENWGWIVPQDARPEAEDRGRITWLSFQDLAQVFDASEAKHVLLALDCCYGGRMTESRTTEAETWRREYLTQRARVILTSGRKDQAVSDGERGQNSPFAQALIEQLSRRDVEALTDSEIFVNIRSRLAAAEVGHIPSRGYPTGHPQNREVVFFLK